jgi:hypothetical protein
VIQLDVANHLVAFPASSSVDEVARACAARGWFFPGPVGDFTASELLRASTIFGDAFVARARFAQGGVETTTNAAPRSATGSDLIGALLVGEAEPTRLWVRVFDKVRSGMTHETEPSAAAAAARVAEACALGRDFVVAARGAEVVSIGPRGTGEPAAWHDFARVEAPGGSALNPADEGAMTETLDAGRLVVAAPFLGRAGIAGGAAAERAGIRGLVAALRDAGGAP